MTDRTGRARVLIVEARFYTEIADALATGAEAALDAAGATYLRVAVPGAFEIPAAIAMAWHGREEVFDGAVALGCVVRGETTHYDYVCQESARALQNLAVDYAVPIGYGILTCETGEQAWRRADPAGKDKGGEAARACLEMIALKRRFGATAAPR